ncbi:hypothetical protein RJ640_026377 [Escallonia rubra]|uniref:Rubisco LSMT substrate-binding domain-containing protein n=1 Tax=Escallonia rubra TaxID=112253 RepID=A0AA88U2I9_9ASTE|nr:hypothetical protein RJ640_026377 [Escallonia rubra]
MCESGSTFGAARRSLRILPLILEVSLIKENTAAPTRNGLIFNLLLLLAILAPNPWDVIQFSGTSSIHLDSFLSVFNISGLPEDYYHNRRLSNDGDSFVDGAVLAAARTLPTWSDGDVPPIPSLERKAVKELQDECQQMLAEFSTTSQQDQQILDSMPEARRTLETAIKYRLHRKLFLEKIIQALDIYQERILF